MLSAIAGGATRRGEIAAVLGRPDSALHHPLAALEQLRLVERLDDAFRQRRPTYRIAEPLIRFHQLVIRPNEASLAAHGGAQVWPRAADVVASKIYGPHLEDLARHWCLAHAEPETTGGNPNRVLPATVPCRDHRTGHELDVVLIEERPQQPKRVLAIGEVKATTKLVGEGELARLDHLRALVPSELVAGPPPRLLIFSRSGFTAGLRRAAAARHDLELIGLDRLYRGG